MRNRTRTTIIADTYFTKLRWIQQVNVNSGGTFAQSITTRGNSAFDPALDGATGSQPIGFQQLSGLYDRYKVMGSRMKIIFANTSDAPVNLMIVPSVTSTPISIIDGYGNAYSKIRMVGQAGGIDVTHMQSYISTVKIRGEIEARYDEDYSALTTASPSRLWFWQVLVEAANQSNVVTGNINLIVDFYVKFSKRKSLTATTGSVNVQEQDG